MARQNRTGPASHGLSLRSKIQNKPEKYEFARKLRARRTPSEQRLWARIGNNRLGFKFRQQAIIRGWIVDFWCPQVLLVVEVDGGYHDTRAQAAEDARRDRAMAELGITVQRFTNAEVDADVERVAAAIFKAACDCARRRSL